jgi:hypothetical protein
MPAVQGVDAGQQGACLRLQPVSRAGEWLSGLQDAAEWHPCYRLLVCLPDSIINPHPINILSQVLFVAPRLQVYEATKRAIPDITAHSKEAKAHSGLKDVRRTSQLCRLAHAAQGLGWLRGWLPTGTAR